MEKKSQISRIQNGNMQLYIPVPEIIDPVFAKTSQNARFLLSEYERFGLVFTKTRVYKFGHRSCGAYAYMWEQTSSFQTLSIEQSNIDVILFYMAQLKNMLRKGF